MPLTVLLRYSRPTERLHHRRRRLSVQRCPASHRRLLRAVDGRRAAARVAPAPGCGHLDQAGLVC